MHANVVKLIDQETATIQKRLDVVTKERDRLLSENSVLKSKIDLLESLPEKVMEWPVASKKPSNTKK